MLGSAKQRFSAPSASAAQKVRPEDVSLGWDESVIAASQSCSVEKLRKLTIDTCAASDTAVASTTYTAAAEQAMAYLAEVVPRSVKSALRRHWLQKQIAA